MREKIILQDFTVLLVCHSQKWSTIERRALFDSTFFRNIGCNPVILCFKGSQLDREADEEDIPRVYMNSKVSFSLSFQFLMELRRLILEQRFDIVHCYSLTSLWFSALILGQQQQTPLFLTFGQNTHKLPHYLIAKWLLKRVDYIFTFSKEVEDYVKETFPIPAKKARCLGVGVEITRRSKKLRDTKVIGVVINNMTELEQLDFPIRALRLLQSNISENNDGLELHLFLGPRVYQQDLARDILTTLDYEFYKGDIHLSELKGKENFLREVDLFFGTAFDEPINDYEISSLLYKIPVLFPRTAMRQNLLQSYPGIGESYIAGDLREVRSKLLKMLSSQKQYEKKLGVFNSLIRETHGLEIYAERLQNFYELAFAKRRNFKKKKDFKF